MATTSWSCRSGHSIGPLSSVPLAMVQLFPMTLSRRLWDPGRLTLSRRLWDPGIRSTACVNMTIVSRRWSLTHHGASVGLDAHMLVARLLPAVPNASTTNVFTNCGHWRALVARSLLPLHQSELKGRVWDPGMALIAKFEHTRAAARSVIPSLFHCSHPVSSRTTVLNIHFSLAINPCLFGL